MLKPHFKLINRQSVKQLLLSILFVLGLLIGLGVGPVTSSEHFRSSAMAQAVSADHLMRQGVEYYHTRNFPAAIQAWRAALVLYQNDRNLQQVALVLENLARAQQALGQTDEELHNWEQAESTYRQIGNNQQVGRMLTEQSQFYSRLGQYGTAINLLCGAPNQSCRADSALGILRSLPTQDLVGEMAALGSLGDAYRLQGKAEQAIEYLRGSLAIAETLQQPAYLASVYNSLGNAYFSLAQLNYRRALSAQQIGETQEAEKFVELAQTYDAEALKYLEASSSQAQTDRDSIAELRARVSALPIYYRIDQATGQNRLQQAISLIATLPDSEERVYAAIDLSRFAQLPSGTAPSYIRDCIRQAVAPQAEAMLQQAIATAQRMGDQRAESFALGELGHLYECQPDYERALTLTQQAQWAADQQLQARDSLYLWQWQSGRILKALDRPIEAIKSYEESLATLNALRQDILTTSRDIQFDFRESVEPIYRELVALRLQQEQPSVLKSVPVSISSDSRTEDNISLALKTLDNLKLAELQNYFGDDCVLTALNTENRTAIVTSRTAVFSTALLEDRVAVIVNFSVQTSGGETQNLQQFEWIKDDFGNEIDQDKVIDTINAYREGLERIRDAVPGAPLGGYDPKLATQLYDWLIRPFEPLLQQYQVKTLVFVQDGIFRSAPMTALYNGSKFLIQNYAVAMTPSLGLTDLDTIERQQLRALAVGLTQSTVVNDIPFANLNYVQAELEAVRALLPRSLELKDETFTVSQFEQALAADTYPIIHIATHGKFSAESENAFLVTGDNLTQTEPKLTLAVLDDLIREKSSRTSVELLVLSACQTATGDDRAALGLAGIAAQAGAKRVLASLWSINDQATTELIEQFYKGLLDSKLTQAQALQAAQQVLINSGSRTTHPGYWSAFVLIGNWL